MFQNGKGIHMVAIIAPAFSNERQWPVREIKKKKGEGKKKRKRKARNFNAHKSRKLLSGHYRGSIHALSRSRACNVRCHTPHTVRMIPSTDRNASTR